jgi:hypothetical protein
MTKILWNDAGYPLMAYGSKYFASTTGAPSGGAKPKTTEVTHPVDDKTSVSNVELASWGADNGFPDFALQTIGKTGVLNTGLKFIRNFTLGQGIFPVRITGFDNEGNEQLEVVSDPEITRLLSGRMIRRYLSNALRDYLKFGVAFPELIPSADGSRIVGINTVNARFCRFTIAKAGVIEQVAVSGDWPDAPQGNPVMLPLLDQYDPLGDIERRKLAGKSTGKSFIYPLRDEWGNEDYYPLPAWYSAYLSGWVTIANKVPLFLQKAYANQITWLWHIKIPYAYWEKKYPKNLYKDETARKEMISAEMDEIENALIGEANANKAIFSMYEINAQGKPEEQWIIEPLDNKYKEGDKLVTSAAANSEILFSLMLNPNVMGAGMPGGTYAGNQGGSNIREAFLVNIANAWIDRQTILDPIELMLAYNGIKDVELRFRNTILTTLDTGAGTTKKLS